MARLSDPGRVVMSEDACSCIVSQGLLYHFPRIHRRLRKRAPEHLIHCEDVVLRIEEYHQEHLVRHTQKPEAKILADSRRTIEAGAVVNALAENPPRQFHRGDKLRVNRLAVSA